LVVSSDLIYWNDRPVPWIALWSAEAVGPTMVSTRTGWEPQRGTKWVRRERGMWMLHAPTRREGTPDFGSTHSARQRRAMELGLCQVCGERRRGEMSWVIPDDSDDGIATRHAELWRQGFVLNAPVCSVCLTLARQVCPHLRQTEPIDVIPLHTSVPVAITGDYCDTDGRVLSVVVPLGDPHTKRMLGREFVVAVER
jgi:hypothetical protein